MNILLNNKNYMQKYLKSIALIPYPKNDGLRLLIHNKHFQEVIFECIAYVFHEAYSITL
jgi:hypothetical protein